MEQAAQQGGCWEIEGKRIYHVTFSCPSLTKCKLKTPERVKRVASSTKELCGKCKKHTPQKKNKENADHSLEAVLQQFSGLELNEAPLLLAIIHEHRMQAHSPASDKYFYEVPQRIVSIESVLRGIGFADVSAQKAAVTCPPSQMQSSLWSSTSSPVRTGRMPDEIATMAISLSETSSLESLLVCDEPIETWELYKTGSKAGSLWSRCKVVSAPVAQKSWLLLVHDEKFLREFVRRCLVAKLGQVTFTEQNGDLYFCPGTLSAALLAAGGAVQAVCELFDESTGKRTDLNASFAIVRPPGHHCGAVEAGGFCLLSNTAIAAKYARQVLGLSRVAIVDLDYHHGDGTQSVFYNDSSVLTISVHVGVTYGSKEEAIPETTYPAGEDKGG
jgi:hypothetical protein